MSDQLKQRVALFLIRMLGRIPFQFGRKIGRGLGRLAYRFDVRSVKVTRENIGLCYPNMPKDEQEALTKASMIETATLAMEILRVMQSGKNWPLQQIVKTHNAHLVTDALAHQKGLIFLGPHIGNWEVISQPLAAFAPNTILYQAPKQVFLEDVIVAHRARQGSKVVPTTQKGVAQILKALRKGESVGILPDQIPNQEGGEFAPFFGNPAFTMTFVHKLIEKTGAKVVFAYAKRVPEGFEVIYKPAPEGIDSEDLATSLKALNQGVEDCVEDCRAQYQWEYKRFRRVPKGQPRHYVF